MITYCGLCNTIPCIDVNKIHHDKYIATVKCTNSKCKMIATSDIEPAYELARNSAIEKWNKGNRLLQLKK